MEPYTICQNCGLKSDNIRLCSKCREENLTYLYMEKEKCLCVRCGTCNHYSSSVCRICMLKLLKIASYKCHSCRKCSLRGDEGIINCEERNDEQGGFCDNCNRWFCNKHHWATRNRGKWFDGENKLITSSSKLFKCTFENDKDKLTCGICRLIDYLAKKVSHETRISKDIILFQLYHNADPTRYTRDQIDKAVINHLKTILKSYKEKRLKTRSE